MTAIPLLKISFAVWIFATVGLAAIFTVSFRYFTYQGNDLDWIYTVGGLFSVLWLLSAFGMTAAAVIAVLNGKQSRGR
jgi:hypothetical protein